MQSRFANLARRLLSKSGSTLVRESCVKQFVTLGLALAVFTAGSAHAAGPEDLPEIGSPATATISLADEYRIGRMMIQGLRDQGQILDDPEVSEYLQSIGLRLSSQAPEAARQFKFLVVKDSTINAFALVGGFVCVNSGLILQTHDESELAGALAHEISHVTQRHIARAVTAQSRNGIISTAAMLAAILLGAAAGGDAALAGVAAAQTLAVEQQVRFSRSEEAEADRVGIGLMAQAGFDPNAMAAFFEVLQRQLGHPDESQIPAILLDHPVTTDRIAEAKARAAQMPAMPTPQDSFGYGLVRERLRVLLTPAGSDPREYYASRTKDDSQTAVTDLYGKGLALMAVGQAKDAVNIFSKLRAGNGQIVQFHTALGQAQLLAGDGRGAIATFERARKLFPRNVPLTVHYGEALMRLGDPKRAHQVLLDLFNVVEPTPDQARLIAQAANAAGDVADAYYYMSEYHIMGGELPLAIGQLQLALNTPNLTQVQKARFTARLEEIQRALPRRVRTQSSADRERISNVSW